MAGNITEKDILENLPTCPTHHIQCIIKTGTKSNSTYGKSFYICNYTKERCSYALPARNISATTCPQHKEMVELKAFADKVEGLKCYYRCLKGRESGVGWCGNSILKKQQQNPLNNITNTYTNQKTNKSSQSDDYMTSTPFKNDKNHSKLDDKLDSPLFHIHKTTYNINTQKPMEKTSEKSVDENTVNNCVTGQRNIVTNPHIYRIPNSAAINKTSASTSMKVTKTISKDNDSSDNSTKSLSDTIEIVSSDDEENQEEDQKSNKHNISPPMISQGSLNEIMEKIKKQKEIYASIGRFAPDGGRKLLDNIDNLVKQYNQMKLQQQDTTAVQQSKQSTINFPKMLSDYPPSLFANIAEQRAAPLFGGRMTESRLKEVGRITKGAIEHLHKSLEACPGPSEESDEPKGLHVSLMTHQKQALLWLLWRERQIPSGGILADDMGLGKTLTMISLVLKSKQADFASNKELPANSKLHSSKATLVICPASLVHQWHKEIEKRVQKSHITVCLYHGTNRDKQVRRLANYDMVLTTYNIVSIEGKPHVESEKDSKGGGHSEWLDASQPKSKALGPLFKIFWRRLILDEGHTVKNHKTAMSISACALESESRWIVTGTPIQNQTMDLYSLIKFLRLSPFDELKVWKREVDNKSNSGTKRMNSIVSSLLLRRTKNQTDQKTGKPLVSLPSRSCILHKLKLSEDEKSVYDLVQNYSKNMFTEYMHRNKDSHSTKDNEVNNADKIPLEVLGMNIDEALSMFGLLSVNSQNMGCLLVLILRLRQCCGHLSLMCEPIDTDICKAEGIEIPLEEQFGNLSIDQPSIANRKRAKQLHPSYSSTKTSSIISILKEFEKSRDSNGKPIKSVIVSQWTRMLDIVAFHLKNNGFRIEFITGSVPAKKRSEIVEAFNNEKYPQIMLVSLKAGGVGLNLIGGSHLFLIDQHWNPALEDQACDRIYRVGQLNDVVIHRFLCEETVEERIVQLQEKKKMLANSVLYGGKSQKLTLNDLQVLFGVSST